MRVAGNDDRRLAIAKARDMRIGVFVLGQVDNVEFDAACLKGAVPCTPRSSAS